MEFIPRAVGSKIWGNDFSDWIYHTRALLKKHVNYANSSLIVNFFKGVKKNQQPRIRKQFITIQKNSVSSPLQYFEVTVLFWFLFSHFSIFIFFFSQTEYFLLTEYLTEMDREGREKRVFISRFY